MVTQSVVQQCRPLAGLPEEARRALGDVAREVRYRSGQRLVPLGQPPQQLLVLTEGLAKLVGITGSGHERILHLHRPGDLVGPTVLLENIRHDYEVTAMSPVAALAISRRDLLVTSRRHPSVIVAVAQEVSRLLGIMTERVLVATSAEIPVRLSHLLLDFVPEAATERLVPLTYPLTHSLMAQIVGASRPHTSTVLRDLEELGAVQRGRKGLLVRPSRLAEIVENGDTVDPRAERALT